MFRDCGSSRFGGTPRRRGSETVTRVGAVLVVDATPEEAEVEEKVVGAVELTSDSRRLLQAEAVTATTSPQIQSRRTTSRTCFAGSTRSGGDVDLITRAILLRAEVPCHVFSRRRDGELVCRLVAEALVGSGHSALCASLGPGRGGPCQGASPRQPSGHQDRDVQLLGPRWRRLYCGHAHARTRSLPASGNPTYSTVPPA